MAHLAEIRLRPGDPAAGARLSRLVNAQLARERAASTRRAWTALVAFASVPLSLALLLPGRLAHGLVRGSLAFWAAAALAAAWSAVDEWKAARLFGQAVRETGERSPSGD
jgi:hypothetical protein